MTDLPALEPDSIHQITITPRIERGKMPLFTVTCSCGDLRQDCISRQDAESWGERHTREAMQEAEEEQ